MPGDGAKRLEIAGVRRQSDERGGARPLIGPWRTIFSVPRRDPLSDHKPESLALFLGLAGDVRRGELAEDCLQWAFEVACVRRIRNRGAALVGAVRRWLSRHGRGNPTHRGEW